MPSLRPPRALVALLALVFLAALPAAASAAPARTLLDRTVDIPGTADRACTSSLPTGTAGAVTSSIATTGVGQIDVALDGDDGDWDVALFDEDGRKLGGGASPSADEVASGFSLGTGTVKIQVCRASGTSDRAGLKATFTPIAVDPTPELTKMVDVLTPTRADKDRLNALGFDMTEHGGTDSLGVVLHGEADEARLKAAGFEYRVEIPDLVAHDQRSRRREMSAAGRAAARRAGVPSGRTTYRMLDEYEADLKKLAGENPGFVKLVELPFKTLLGRTVLGVEITTNPNVNDGKPAFFNMGVHHAREWPSGEHAMEWAYELVNGYKNGDQRVKRIVEESRNIIVPIVNPDGFNQSRTAGIAVPGGRNEELPDTAYAVSGAGTGGEYRRKNCRLGDTDVGNCTTSPGTAVENGTDPNRNYGGLWGGPGAETAVNGLTYRGPGPFSEAETKNIQWMVSRRQVMTLITNHTTAGLVLRAPGLASLGDPVDEDRGYKALGDAMALENGYFSQKSFELYDTTGTTEDWSYNATGGFGFTFEIYCGAPNYKTGDCDDPAFHPLYETMAKEYEGTSAQSNHETDPGRSAENPFGMQAKYDGKGNREAYFIAAESTLDRARHSIITGEGVPGATLRLTKAFKTATFPQEDGKPILFDDKLETVYEVGKDGKFTWHVNPSTRPIVAKQTGRAPEGPPSPKVEITGGPGPDAAPCPTYFDVPGSCTDANWNDHPITFPVGGGTDNELATVRFTFRQSDDWDLELYEDKNGNGISDDADGGPIDNSGNGATNQNLGFEEVVITRPSATKKYVARMINYAAVDPTGYAGEVEFSGPPPLQAAQVESWTLTCEVGGNVVDTQQVQIDRGQVKDVDLSGCRRLLSPQANVQPVPAPRPSTCAAGTGFRSVSATPRGRGLRFSFSRRVNRPVTVSVFQQSTGRRITGERLVARFTRRTKAFTWSGKSTSNRRRVSDGYLFARFSIQTPNGADTRRLTLRRSKGRFAKRPDFYRRATCDALPSFKIERPVFGGASNRPLNISFRIAQAGRVQVDVLRGTSRVKRFGPTNRRAGVTHRLRLDPKSLRRGEYRVRITVFVGARPLTATLVARRL